MFGLASVHVEGHVRRCINEEDYKLTESGQVENTISWDDGGPDVLTCGVRVRVCVFGCGTVCVLLFTAHDSCDTRGTPLKAAYNAGGDKA